MATLYNISERYRNLLELCGDENVNPELLKEALSQLEGELTDKVANGIGLIQELKYRALNLDAEIKRLTKLKKSTESSVEYLQDYYLSKIKACGKTKIWTERGAMSVAKAGGKRPLLIDDEDKIPLEFKKSVVQVLIDKDSVREALERGFEVEGAHLGERGQYLRIS